MTGNSIVIKTRTHQRYLIFVIFNKMLIFKNSSILKFYDG